MELWPCLFCLFFFICKLGITMLCCDWRDDSAIHSTCYTYGGPGFGSQYSHPSLTPVPRYQTSSSNLHEHQVLTSCHRTCAYMQTKHYYTENKQYLKKTPVLWCCWARANRLPISASEILVKLPEWRIWDYAKSVMLVKAMQSRAHSSPLKSTI